MPRALISVSDKTGIVEFATSLTALGWEVVSTGGTARVLEEAGVAVTGIEEVTGFPEIMDGRVKTLHPAVHGALLARRDLESHMEALQEHGIQPIDLVAVNLYPFKQTIAREGVTLSEAIEQIDIGGPSMLRSAAKNHDSVTVIVDPSDYDAVIWQLKNGGMEDGFGKTLATKVFQHTAGYDATIAAYLGGSEEDFPTALSICAERKQSLRYGENPAQGAALYVLPGMPGIGDLRQLHGKELSYNNLLDVDGALLALAPWKDRIACAVIKHTTPCGLAVAESACEAFCSARATDPTSAFGSVVSLTTACDLSTAQAMSDLFMEVVIAPSFDPDALEVLQKKKNLRIIEYPVGRSTDQVDFRSVAGAILAQQRFQFDPDESGWKVVTDRTPTETEWADLRFAWAAVAAVKSNAILLARNNAAIGIGAGQMSRVDASHLAAHKAQLAGHDTRGSALASDAFFPFPDGVEEAAKVGVTTIIQPGGSIRDSEVIGAANAHRIAMVMTGKRQFRH